MVINDKEKYNQIKSTISMKNIKKLLNDKEFTVLKLAMNTGVSVTTINGYISGERYPSITNLVSMANFLNCSTDFLLGRTNTPTSMENENDLDLNILLNSIAKLPKAKQKLVSAYVQGLRDQ